MVKHVCGYATYTPVYLVFRIVYDTQSSSHAYLCLTRDRLTVGGEEVALTVLLAALL